MSVLTPRDHDSALARTTLPEGVVVLTESIPAMRSVAVGAWVNVGSRDETPAECGLTHFIEHMVFKGTEKRRVHHIAARMESVGGYLNAFTTKEYTCYYARALDAHLNRALDTVLDLVAHPVFPEGELEKEKDVVIEEMKKYEDDPDDLVFDRFEAVIYPDHALGKPILGFPETVSTFTRAGLQDFMARHYTPGRLVVTVAGNVTHEAVVRQTRALLKDFRAPAPAPARYAANGYTPTEHLEPRPIQQAHVVIGTRGVSLHDVARRTSVNVLNTILGSGMASRLNLRIREKYGYCYDVYSFVNQLTDTGDIGVYIGVDGDRVARARQLVVRELVDLAEHAVSAQSLERAKTQLKGSMMLGLESLSNRMMRLGRIEMAGLPHFSLDEMSVQIDAVTAADVQALAADLFRPESLSTVALIPEA